MIDSKWSACGPWCDNYVPGRLGNFCVDVNETDGPMAVRVALGDACRYRRTVAQLSFDLREAGLL